MLKIFLSLYIIITYVFTQQKQALVNGFEIGNSMENKPRAHRAWQLHHNYKTWIRMMIDNAESLGINAIQLSHNIIMNANDLNNSWTKNIVSDAEKYVNQKGLNATVNI